MDERERHLRIAEIFAGAVDLEGEARDAFLGRECEGDEDLERDVRSVLLFDRAESLVPIRVRTPAETPEETDLTGRTVGRCTVVAKLGKGGMGTVWKAEDPLLGRTVAIKFLSANQRDNDLARRRFLREARAASALTHPDVATVYEVGELDGVPYIAMQLVEGRTIRQHVREEHLPPVRAVRIAARVAEILDDAHAHGVVHRDITSNNIMVQPDGTPKVVDFGVARRAADTSRLSRTGVTVGTVGFIAPEVIEGRDATPQSDIFGLGVVLYEMVTGRMPFENKRMDRVLHATLTLDPESPRRLVADVPRELDRIVMKALSRRLTTRYQTAREMADDLQNLLESGALRASSESRRRRHAVAIIAVIALVVVAVLIGRRVL
jgi:eukaryotic-like serine/threonine-protein kinase